MMKQQCSCNYITFIYFIFQACDLFLKNRSAIIKYNIRQLKFEGATSLYIRRLCGVFFPSLMETGREFLKAFQEHYGCMSGKETTCQQCAYSGLGFFKVAFYLYMCKETILFRQHLLCGPKMNCSRLWRHLDDKFSEGNLT